MFIGSNAQDYAALLHNDTAELGGYLAIGNAASVMSGRIAYSLGFRGPAATVDTACSSSLVALHWAAQALRRSECSMALVGGASVMSTPGAFLEFSRQRGLAADGRCKAFAEAADGTGWGEGIGMLLVERLSDARSNGHRVLAVVRGSAINQDGASSGLTVPHGPSQQRVIRQALSDAGLSPADVDVVEAHGTGTRLGDPIEAQSLLATYGQDRHENRPLRLGSLKSNIGHTAGAAGVAGVIKMVMAMRHGVLPQTLHVDKPSAHVDWTAGRVELLTEQMDWPETGEPRRAGVSSFGISGTNAHVILEQAVLDSPSAPGPADAPGTDARTLLATSTAPWVLSGKSPEAVAAQAARLLAHLETRRGGDPAPVDIAWSLATTRASLEHRVALVAEDHDGFLSALRSVAHVGTAPGAVQGTASRRVKPVFVFPGQGAQWTGMASGLVESSPVFAARLAECGEALAPYTDWSLLDVVRRVEGAPSSDRADVMQLVLWAVMVSLAELWRSCGVEPAAVIGHSQGEITAATVAGALSLPDAARLVARRREVTMPLSGKGGMVSVPRPVEWVREQVQICV